MSNPIPVIETPSLRMPKLGFGTWRLAGKEGEAAIESALALGYRHLDTAEMYGNEAEVGAAIARSGVPRAELFVTTKAWPLTPDGKDKLTPRGILEAAQDSLGRLVLDQVDLYLIHWPGPAMNLAAAIEGLVAVRDAGLARAVGVANFPVGLLRRAIGEIGAPIAAVQVEYHAELSQDRLLDYLRPLGIPLTAYSPLAKGELRDEPVLARIGEKHGVSAAQVALAWLLEQEGVAAIPKAASRRSQEANLAALAVKLDEVDRAAIDGLPKDRRRVSPAFAPDWSA
ncbi:aldo/keto reductase [Roseomonas sp. NAR14]|uniref:Aldo/keto reductase n=1 Tax=Roseomonas acroporae TaxID=2937791 RepID=A0A9X2BXT6_9PROT|nr:aldo/keto reductase [Roseomonas acroporae]MCK8785310.1 aldo/keto reductase [Roseomonas acroporae]